MQFFINSLGFILACCAGIILLTLFFKLMGKLDKTPDSPAPSLTKRMIFKSDEQVDVHLHGNQVHKNLSWLCGISESSTFSDDLQGMIAFERPNGQRLLIKSKLITLIETSEATSTT